VDNAKTWLRYADVSVFDRTAHEKQTKDRATFNRFRFCPSMRGEEVIRVVGETYPARSVKFPETTSNRWFLFLSLEYPTNTKTVEIIKSRQKLIQWNSRAH
jgi:hypothetical protein